MPISSTNGRNLRRCHGSLQVFDKLVETLRVKYYACSTEQTYVEWVARNLKPHQLLHPATERPLYRHPMHESNVQRIISSVCRLASISKPFGTHTLRA